MAQPQAYDRTVDFTQRDGDDTDHAGINAELDAAAISINGIRDNLALIQKDDGGLANGIVTPDSLAPEVFEALTLDISEQVADASASAQSALNSAISAAASAAAAAASQVAVTTSENASALNASGAAASASAAAGSQTAVAASAAAALVSQNAAASSASAASTSAGTATTQAGIATTQAGIATTQATNAATSATTATTQAGIATTQAGTATTQAGIATAQAGTAITQAAAAAASATAAAASASAINLPAIIGKAINWLRVKADESGYETRTPAEARADIGAAKAGADDTITSMTALTAGGLPNASIVAANLSGAQTGSAPVYGLRAWVNFNGTGTVAIRASGNVSSITDNGTGDYTINFTTAMPDANYGVLYGSTGQNTSNIDAQIAIHGTAASGATTKTTTGIRVVFAGVAAFSAIDCAEMNIGIVR